MNISHHHRYFMTSGYIDTCDIFRPLRAAKSDKEIAEIVAQMDREGKKILGKRFWLKFDRTNASRDIAGRIHIRKY